jgi:hypothetical protein
MQGDSILYQLVLLILVGLLSATCSMKKKCAIFYAFSVLKRTVARSFVMYFITVIISLPQPHSSPFVVLTAEGFLKGIPDYQNSFLFSSLNYLSNHFHLQYMSSLVLQLRSTVQEI